MKEVDSNGVQSESVVTEQRNIEWEVQKYYWKQYRNEESVINKEDILEMIGQVKKINEADKENLESTITMEDVSQTLKNTRNNVAPGVGGFTGAFYKVFLCLLKKVVLGAMHEIFKNKKLPLTVRLGIIALIPKGDKDLRYISKWRPLTLLDMLYKLLSTTLASRLKTTLDRILGSEQKAYVPGCFISECTRNTYDIFTQAKENNLPGKIILIDFRKAFDSVNFTFIMTTLEIF